MSIWEIAVCFVALLLSVWLGKKAIEWHAWGNGYRACSRPDGHERNMAEIRAQIAELEQRLAWYQATPDWFDVVYPVCDSPIPASDGYCRSCYRAMEDHALVGVS